MFILLFKLGIILDMIASSALVIYSANVKKLMSARILERVRAKYIYKEVSYILHLFYFKIHFLAAFQVIICVNDYQTRDVVIL